MPSLVMLLVRDQVAFFLNHALDGGEEFKGEERYAGRFLCVFERTPGGGEELAVGVNYVGLRRVGFMVRGLERGREGKGREVADDILDVG
jgi:hypothetical protein